MRFKLLLLFCLASFYCYAQIPDGYYNTTTGKTGDELRASLRDIIKTGHVKIPYTSSAFDIWDAYKVTDVRPAPLDTVIWDMYSDIPTSSPQYTFTIVSNQCGTASAEGDCYSREHQMPNSWWGGLDNASNPQYTDLHHLPPTDQYVNNKKSAHPIGETNTPTYTSSNGSKLGPCSWSGYTGVVFEPIDEYKGDFARAYLYLATRYMDVIGSWLTSYPTTEAQYIINSSANNYQEWFLEMLVTWSNNDPVSIKEINRNNAIYYQTPQHNRNPFIDHPEFVNSIWDQTVSALAIEKENIKISPNPTTGIINIYGIKNSTVVYIYSIDGQLLKSAILSSENTQVDISDYKNGIYIVKIQNQESVKVVCISKV
ncbi:MAG: endonuclease [Bacteroidota bacterium]